jgi:hypothetical protein
MSFILVGGAETHAARFTVHSSHRAPINSTRAAQFEHDQIPIRGFRAVAVRALHGRSANAARRVHSALP